MLQTGKAAKAFKDPEDVTFSGKAVACLAAGINDILRLNNCLFNSNSL